MVRLVVYLLGIVGLAVGLSWLADNPGTIQIEWQGYTANPSVFQAVIVLAVLMALTLMVWSLLWNLWQSPAHIGSFFLKRRNKKGLESLSSGMIAIGAGDRAMATRYAIQARKALPNEPLTHLLRAQAAQLSGDRQTARHLYDTMLASPETEQLGLRGLFLEAEREGEAEAARNYAERALALNPKLGWSADALFELQCRQADWAGALETLALAKRHGHMEKPVADRRRAVLLTAKAMAAEDDAPDKAMALALEAHSLAPDLIPAASIAARILAARGSTQKAAKVIQKTWRRAAHPDLATAYAYARIGDSPRDRLNRIRNLAALNLHSIESPIALAGAAIEAREWAVARHALSPLLEGGLTQRICTLMAKIEGGEFGDAGRVREWLARAVNAPRDPAWTADGMVADTWAPVSPVTGQLDAFQWRVPVESAPGTDQAAILGKLEELVALGARPEADAQSAAEMPASLPPRQQPRTAAPGPAAAPLPATSETDAGWSSAPATMQPAATAPPAAENVPMPLTATRAPSAQPVSLKPVPLTPVAAPALQSAAPSAAVTPATTSLLPATAMVTSGQPVRPVAVPAAPTKPAAPAAPATTAISASPSTAALDSTGPSAAMADGVLRTVRAAAPAAAANSAVPASQPNAPKKSAPANVYVAPHAPDDPGPDDDDAAAEEKRPYMVPYTRPVKLRP